MCTTALVFGALMMYARRDLLNPEHKALFQSYEGERRAAVAALTRLVNL